MKNIFYLINNNMCIPHPGYVNTDGTHVKIALMYQY